MTKELVDWLRESADDDPSTQPLIEAADTLESQSQELARLRGALTPSADTKAAYMGEFRFGIRMRHPKTGEEDRRSIDVPWTTIKEIMAAIRARAALSGEGE